MPAKGSFIRPDITKEILEELYCNQRLSTPQTAGILGICHSTVWNRLRHFNIPVRTSAEGNTCRLGRKGYKKTPEGYIKVILPNHPRAVGRYVLEHILIWEQVHQKHLPKGWTIHHANGIKDDNRPENLIAMPRRRHDNYIPELKKRIHNLEIRVTQIEAENTLLQKALEDKQAIFYITTAK